jgi:hypothetical protein
MKICNKTIILIFIIFLFVSQKINSQNNDSLDIKWNYNLLMEPYIFDNGIIITPPPYFIPFKKVDKQGFMNLQMLSSIEVQIQNNIPFTIVAQQIKENLDKQKIFLINEEKNLTNSNKTCLIYEFIYNSMSSNGEDIDFHQIILITGDYNQSIIAIAVFPEKHYKLLHTVMRESLLSIDWRDSKS